ncbi:transposase, IS605 OrfB family [Methanocaldococcus sp. FS406-22]|uniref:RNA-guided endonuclease TnpB family protein n=1 Tax=Methanocaldococcus sp. (strain FS406-22) TaxID=644281 RepID=UPI0001C4E15B|nr:RNA-guided endonuclease TnpB family protein [Methanocaldococcus sp. FS406-22]ADC69297.1 transposase, IS605 OrfB family [Methanocaldococcus sp. FS406-22]
MSEIIKLTKTIVLKSKPLTKTKIKIIENIIEMYKDVLSIALNFGLKNKRKSHRKIREVIYEEIKIKYPKLPTHYIYTASQDASTRIKSFISMKKKNKACTSKPEVRNVSLWLDDILFNYKNFKTNIERLFSINKEGKKTLHLRLSTPNGRIVIPLKPHKQFFKLLNEGWKIKAGFKLRLNKEDGTIAVLIPLENEITINDNFKEVYALDFNLDNITYGNFENIKMIKTDLGKLTEKYSNIMANIQEKFSFKVIHRQDKPLKKKGFVLLKKFGRRLKNIREDKLKKLANKIAKELRDKNAVLIIEDLSPYFNQNIAKKSFKNLKHKLHNISAKKFLGYLKNKCLEFGVKVVEVNPAYTSVLCPNCGNRLSQLYKLVDERALPSRPMYCFECGFYADRDAVAVFNLIKRFWGLSVVPKSPMRP